MRSHSLIAFLLLLSLAACQPQEKSPEESASSEGATSESTTPETTSQAAATTKTTTEQTAEVAPNPILARHLLTEKEIREGWISLFDGHTLFGWKSSNPEIQWKVENNAITAEVGPVGLLLTTVPFADFELVCEFRMETNGNSGLFLRTTEDPKDLTKDCFELNITDEQPDGYLTGSLVNRKKTDSPIQGSGDWQTFHVKAVGNHFTVMHNGKPVLDYLDSNESSRAMGYIGLQQRFGKIQFRKLNLKPLGMQSLFNGKDLQGWHEVAGSKSKFTVVEGMIHVENGAGFLETEKTYQDFIFQADARTNAKDLNSGYFFRAEPGTEKAPSNGYEVQIHNGFKDGDRNQPANAGTGAIFRRVEARRVVSDDLKWFTTTLLASGPHISVWVDGYQVVDWIDKRPPNKNPRKGLRLEAGHISLQGHDPTTDVDFRNIKIQPLQSSSKESESK